MNHMVTFQQVYVRAGGVPAQRVEHQGDGAVLLHRVGVGRPLIVQHHGGVHPGAQAAPDLLVPGQYLLQAQHGALGPAADDCVAAGVDGAADVSRAEGEKRAAVQQQALGAVVLQEPLQHRAVHLTQLIHCTSFQGECVSFTVSIISCISVSLSVIPPPSKPGEGARILLWLLLSAHLVSRGAHCNRTTFTHSPATSFCLALFLSECFSSGLFLFFPFFFNEWVLASRRR